jgi:cobalt/nickel transport system ATP-binding protein
VTPALACDNVTVFHDGCPTPALRGVTLAIEPGERVALVGNNGSGKTTLLYAAAGLLPFEGTITVCGIASSRSTLRKIRTRIGFLFATPEDQILFPRVIDDVAFSLLSRGLGRAEALGRAHEMLAELGIDHLAGEAPFRLSHGQRLRVALAGALVSRPPLLLLDEPSAGLDPPGKEHLIGILTRSSGGMLIATHDREFAELTCGRRLELRDGVIGG